jgi:hypothetical protein
MRLSRAKSTPHQIAFNVLPQVDSFLPTGYTKEEMKMENEGRKIMHHPNFRASVTCVRVPVYRAHSVAVSADFDKPVSVEAAREVLAKAPGLDIVDNPEKSEYPLPLYVAERDNCQVGRIRKDCAMDNGLCFWVVGDQLLKGRSAQRGANRRRVAEVILGPMFRPCIDLHEGRVKQIVGGTLDTSGLRTNFVSEKPSSWYAELYRRDQLRGGTVIMLGPGNESAALEALRAYPGGLQLGGGVTIDNAKRYLDAGASHVIVTSWVFRDGQIDWDRLKALVALISKKRLVLDLSLPQTRRPIFRCHQSLAELHLDRPEQGNPRLFRRLLRRVPHSRG